MIGDVVSFLGESHPLAQWIRRALDRKPSDGFAVPSFLGQAEGGLGDLSYSGSSVELEYASDIPPEDDLYWHAEMCIGEILEPDDPLIIYVTNAHGDPIQTGEFVFLGRAYRVNGGVVESTLRHFKENLDVTEISLTRETGGTKVPGSFLW